MERGKRIPLHNHDGPHSGGLIAAGTVVTLVGDSGGTTGGGAATAAVDVTVEDAAANFTGTNVEAVLAELQDNIDAVGGILSNYSATTDPTTGDDSGDGYAVGSRWINTTTDEEFVCTDATSTAAVWVSTTDQGSGSGVATDAIWDAAGDLAVGTGANTAARLAAGSEDDVLTIVSGVPAWAAPAPGGSGLAGPPTIVQAAATYQNSGTTCVVTLGAAPTHTLLAFIGATARGASSITQTNVTWTKLYGGNGNSQYGEIWAGSITGAAGTTVTANFASATRSQVIVHEVDHADFTTAGTAVTSTANSQVLYNGPLTTPTAGDICVAVSATNGASWSMGALNVPWYSFGYAGGQGWDAIFTMPDYGVHYTRLLSGSMTWFTAMLKIS